MKFSLSVVIPNYNGRELLEENLPFLYTALSSSGVKDYEVIISDDNSQDESVKFLRDEYPDIIVITNETNKGFSGNTNIGIRRATKDLVLILNSDIQLEKGYFLPLFKYFELPDTFGVMGGIIESRDGKVLFAARYPEYSFGKINPGKNFISEETNSMVTYFHSGANALVDRQKLLELDGFDETFDPYYYEDDDLGWRAWRIGYKLYYDHSVYCYHRKSSTIDREPSKKVYRIYKRNKFYYHYIHFDGVELWYYMIKQGVKAIVRAIAFDSNYTASYLLFMKSLRKLNATKRKFRELQKSKNVNYSMRDIVRIIKTDLNKISITKI